MAGVVGELSVGPPLGIFNSCSNSFLLNDDIFIIIKTHRSLWH